jgi:hypothetical protein
MIPSFYKPNVLAWPVLAILFCLLFPNNSQAQSTSDTTVIELFAIPGPDEILHYVNKDELKFTTAILNSTKKTDRYITSKDQYIALGVYIADLAYCLSFKQTAKALDYLNVIDDLGKSLNVFPTNMDDIKNRFSENLGNIDTLKQLYLEVYELTMDKMFESSRFNHYTLVSAGTFVESIYLALNSTQAKTQSKDFRRRLGDQNYISQQLMSMYNKNLDKKTKELVLAEYNPLALAFDEFGSKASPASAKKRYDGAIVINKHKEEMVESESFSSLHAELAKLRAVWTKNLK